MSEPPWIFRYVEDPADETARRLGRSAPLRPAVTVRLSDRNDSPRIVALVDSGSERTLAAPGLARAIGVDLSSTPEVEIGIGGGWRGVRFAAVRLQMFPTLFGAKEEPLAEWEAEVGFFTNWTPAWGVVLGGIGFFDQFTVTMQRAVPALAVDRYEEFDERYGSIIEVTDETQPRFRY